MTHAPLITLHHHITDSPEPAVRPLGVVTPVATFLAHLDRLERRFDIIDLDRLLAGNLPRRPLLLTFDDSYHSLVDTVGPILKRRALPAVAFLTTDVVEKPAVMLDHVLAQAAALIGEASVMQALGPPAAGCTGITAFIGGPLATMRLDARDRLQAALMARIGQTAASLKSGLGLYLSPADVARLAGFGIEVANHTASHCRCRTLDAVGTVAEITAPKARLEHLSGRQVRAFSSPYGAERDLTPRVLDALRDSGHRAIFTVEGRSNRQRPAPDVWHRVSLDGVAPGRLDAVLSHQPALRTAKYALRNLLAIRR